MPLWTINTLCLHYIKVRVSSRHLNCPKVDEHASAPRLCRDPEAVPSRLPGPRLSFPARRWARVVSALRQILEISIWWSRFSSDGAGCCTQASSQSHQTGNHVVGRQGPDSSDEGAAPPCAAEIMRRGPIRRWIGTIQGIALGWRRAHLGSDREPDNCQSGRGASLHVRLVRTHHSAAARPDIPVQKA